MVQFANNILYIYICISCIYIYCVYIYIHYIIYTYILIGIGTRIQVIFIIQYLYGIFQYHFHAWHWHNNIYNVLTVPDTSPLLPIMIIPIPCVTRLIIIPTPCFNMGFPNK